MRWIRTSWDAVWLWIDWHGRITTVVAIIVALGGAALVNRAASVWGEVHGIYLYATSGLAFAIFLATIAIVGRKMEVRGGTEQSIRDEQSKDKPGPPRRASTAGGPAQEAEPTLLSLLDTSFPRFFKVAKDLPIQFDDKSVLTVRAVLYFDVTANSTFLGIHIPSSPDTIAACLVFARQVREIAQHMSEAGLRVIATAPGENPQELRDYGFTGKVYIHHDLRLTHEEMGQIEGAFQSLKLTVVLRGPDFLTQAWIAWKDKLTKMGPSDRTIENPGSTLDHPPEVVVSKITCDSRGMFPETVLTLHNANKTSAAQKVRVCDIELTSGKATFREIPLLVADGTESVVPRIKSDGGAFRQRDLLNLIRTHCLNNSPTELLKECAIPGVILFEDLSGNSFETHFEFVFYPLAHTIREIAQNERTREEQIVLEARRFRFRRAA